MSRTEFLPEYTPDLRGVDAGGQIYARRMALGMTATELARRAGVDRGTLRLAERGDSSLRTTTIERLAAVLGAEWDGDHLTTVRPKLTPLD